MRWLLCIFSRQEGTANFLSNLEVHKMSKIDLLTAQELADRLQVRPSTVREWDGQGKVPAFRLSRKVVRYSLDAVVNVIGQVAPASAIRHPA
jgi:hypothetical protein